MKTFIILDPQEKGKPFADALVSAGWTQVDPSDWKPVDLLMLNHDHPISNYRAAIDYQADNGGKIIIYPDGFNPSIEWDGIHLPYRNDAVLVISERHRQIMQTWNHPVPMHVIGWPWTPVKDFQPTSGQRILFAPIHPDGNGYLQPDDLLNNRAVYTALLAMDSIDLKVRYLGRIEQNGLHSVDGVVYKSGRYDNSHYDIHTADVVIASGTYAAMAIALGKPTICFEQLLPRTPHRDDYLPLMRYPMTWKPGIDLPNMIDMVCSGMQEADNWKTEYIGSQMNPAHVVSIIEEIYDDG